MLIGVANVEANRTLTKIYLELNHVKEKISRTSWTV